jgi:hypothetical protein
MLCPVPFNHHRVDEDRESRARPLVNRLYSMPRDFLTTEDVVPIFQLLLIEQEMAELGEMGILNMMEVDDDAKRIL